MSMFRRGVTILSVLFFVFSIGAVKAQDEWDYETGSDTTTNVNTQCFLNYCVGDLVQNINTNATGYIEALYPDQYQALVRFNYNVPQMTYIDELQNLSRQNPYPNPNPNPGTQCAAGFCVGEQVRVTYSYPYPQNEIGIILQLHPARYSATVSFPQSGVREISFNQLQRVGGGYPYPNPNPYPNVRCLQGFCTGDLVEWRYAQTYDRTGRIIAINQQAFSAQVRFNSTGAVTQVRLAELRLLSSTGGRPSPRPTHPGYGRP